MTTVTTMGGSQSRISGASRATPVVFVIDDDISVRESLELMVQASGWRAETFPSAQEFLARPRALVPSCLILDVASRISTDWISEARRCRPAGHANHLHHRAR